MDVASLVWWMFASKILTVTSNPHHCPCLCTFRCDLLAMQIDNNNWFISGMSYSLLTSDLLDWSYAHKFWAIWKWTHYRGIMENELESPKGFWVTTKRYKLEIGYAICPAFNVQERGLSYLLLSVILHGLLHFLTWNRLQPVLLGCGREELSVLVLLKVWYVCFIVSWQFPIGIYFQWLLF